MAVSAVVLAVLLSEMIRLYVELSHANTVLEQERTSKLMTIEGAMSSIAHEVSQPLTGVVMNTRAARRWLQRDPPELDKVTQCLSVAEQASFHASEIIGNIRKLFAVADQEVELIDANKLALGARDILRGALNDYGVACDMELAFE
jgi:signal transduction histidine kinase